MNILTWLGLVLAVTIPKPVEVVVEPTHNYANPVIVHMGYINDASKERWMIEGLLEDKPCQLFLTETIQWKREGNVVFVGPDAKKVKLALVHDLNKSNAIVWGESSKWSPPQIQEGSMSPNDMVIIWIVAGLGLLFLLALSQQEFEQQPMKPVEDGPESEKTCECGCGMKFVHVCEGSTIDGIPVEQWEKEEAERQAIHDKNMKERENEPST